ncbi:hypothetical protein BHUM_05460 [Candidatus Burkholderia humilis]|nr:hypothetical protein BHUM_05460 [Candidatus Burkholderia humilis]
MNQRTEHVKRRIRKIFGGQDDRLVVLLRCAPHTLTGQNAVKCLSALQATYENELEIVPFVAVASPPVALTDALSGSSPAGCAAPASHLPLNTRVPARPNGCCPGRYGTAMRR